MGDKGAAERTLRDGFEMIEDQLPDTAAAGVSSGLRAGMRAARG
ncbi:hypothetical protein ULF88_12285 [Halopseudomonas pachastrellae]|nr:hypothetical protein [Halopseudomonas pachastrellae]